MKKTYSMPFKCPLCEGSGIKIVCTSTLEDMQKIGHIIQRGTVGCIPCHGKGIIWTPVVENSSQPEAKDDGSN